MTNIEKLQHDVEIAQKQLEEATKSLEMAKKEETWPNWGNEYWYASSNGGVYVSYWESSYEDNNRFKFGNVHRSQVEGKAYVQKRLVQVELETLAKKAWKEVNEQVNWTDEHQSKYHIYYDYVDKEFIVTANSTCQYTGQVFFPTEESAVNAIETISEERLKVLLK